MPRITVAAAIVQFLKVQFSQRDGQEQRLIQGVFGIFGHGNVTGLGHALQENGHRELPYYQPKNEQAMVHTAIAYAKEKKRLSTYACTTSIGPGATNLVTGAATATINRIPVLLLPGDIFASRVPAPVLQQLEAPFSMDVSVNDSLKVVSRYWDRIYRPEQLLKALPEAMRILLDPAETGAVTLCLPQDVQTEAFDFPSEFFEKRVYNVPRFKAQTEDLEVASQWIRSAKRPLIVAGGGVKYSNANEVLSELSEKCGIPVGMTQAGKGSLLDSHPMSLGGIGVTGSQAANEVAQTADVILAIGTRLTDFTTASQTLFREKDLRFISINVNPSDAHKNRALPLQGDALANLTSLGELLRDYETSSEYQSFIEKAQSGWSAEYQSVVRPRNKNGSRLLQSEVIGILNEKLGMQSTIVHAAGGLPGDLHKLWKVKAHDDYHSEYGYSCMGYEIAGALGVKMARPDKDVYALVGDGSYLMLNHEIVTSIQEGHKITIILLDNQGYQCIHRLQKSCGGSSFGNEFRFRDLETGRLEGESVQIDYVQNARSLGANAYIAETESALARALIESKKDPKTVLIYVPIDSSSSTRGYAWWDVPIAEISKSKATQEARLQYMNSKKEQRLL